MDNVSATGFLVLTFERTVQVSKNKRVKIDLTMKLLLLVIILATIGFLVEWLSNPVLLF